MRSLRMGVFGLVVFCLIVPLGCAEKKETRSVTIEGPEKKTEVKVETTKKHD